MVNESEMFQTNKQGWDERVDVHLKSEFYEMAAFRKGKTSLNKEELEALGDVSGKSLLHLQCHFGQDTLSWARKGAIVTGVDISSEALKAAREISSDLGIPATFIESNILNLKENLSDKFEIVFTSYGTIGWLNDLDKWASIVHHFLKSGGTFYMIDFHPYVWMWNDERSKIEYNYFNTEAPIIVQEKGTYADPDAEVERTEYSWNHGMSEIISALLKAGLELEEFHEYPFSNYNVFPKMKPAGEGRWVFDELGEKVPYMYSLEFNSPKLES
jgi:ubiquinone/menaquinone biosynthesis C-methylase UbiE